ncbi:MAG: PspC family transcriptional regulator [Chitinophagales bacterium]|nr:PspC family transcriptional regulator [Chitinophagales bacterium]
MERIRYFFENQAFGVCSYLGQKMEIPSKRIRIFFIYSSFIAMGSPVIIYLSMAFVLKLRNYIKEIRNPVWDL